MAGNPESASVGVPKVTVSAPASGGSPTGGSAALGAEGSGLSTGTGTAPRSPPKAMPSAAAERSSTTGGLLSPTGGGAAGVGSAPAAPSSRTSTASGKFGMAPRGSALPFRSLGGLSSSYILEKQAVVVDFGHAYTKVGFATEWRPRHIFPTPEIRAWRRKGPLVSLAASEDEWIDILDRLMSKVFFHYLSVSPKDRRVVICDTVRAPTPFRNALAHVLFKRLGVPAVAFVADLVLPLYLTGLSSGIVIDCGYEAARVMPTFAGVPMLSALSAASCGGRRVQRRLGRMLRRGFTAAEGAEASTHERFRDAAVLEDLAVRTGYVSVTIPAADPAEPPLTLKTDKAMGDVPTDCRWKPFETFFSELGDDSGTGEVEDPEDKEDHDGFEGCSCSSLPEAFLRTLTRCPVDVRAAVIQNVVVCGGCAALRGLLPRLALELRSALEREPKTAELARRLVITPLDFAPVAAVWTGAAVFATLEGVGDYTKEDYERGHPLPDWAREGFV